MFDNQLISFVTAHIPELLQKLLQQLYLVGLSTGFAILIGIPLGIWVARNHRVKGLILSFVSILQTIPSLALLAFLLPFFGIGATPAIIALTLYALLPIVRNTFTGLSEVPKDLIEAANGLGFTKMQRLTKVELPLALPMIVAGIRTAISISVGIATLAAFIGAGGLGDFINQGLSMNNVQLVLLGAIPAGMLALLLDLMAAAIERSLTKKRSKGRRLNIKILTIVAVIVLLISLTGTWVYQTWIAQPQSIIRVASKNYTESIILAEMISEMIENHTQLKVVRKFNLGTTTICQKAMERGDIDLYPEYTGTAYLVIMHGSNPGKLSPDEIFQKVKDYYLEQYNILWLSPFGYNNSQALAVAADFAKQHQLTNISQLQALQQQLTIGVMPEFLQRPDGMAGLVKAYNLHFGHIKEMSAGLLYPAIGHGDVNIIMTYPTNGQLLQYHLVVLQDDKHFFPPYYAAPLIRKAVLVKHPEIAKALQPLAGLINAQTMQHLNYLVSVKKLSPQKVVHDFLMRQHLLN